MVGCENVERVDDVIRDALRNAGLSPETMSRLSIPRTVVDRICATDAPPSLTVTAEPFVQLAIGGGPELPGFERVDAIDALFARKRYLVNTFADACAIMGRAAGMRTLAEAVADDAIEARIAPLLDALLRHLATRYGFDMDGLSVHLSDNRARLSNPNIPRRLETVARDLWRKFGPEERFAAPLIELEANGELDDAAVDTVADLMLTAAAIEGSAIPAFALGRRRSRPTRRCRSALLSPRRRRGSGENLED